MENGQLIVRELPSGHVASRRTFDAPVLQVLTLPNQDWCLVLLDPGGSRKPTFENLSKVRADGAVVWTAELPDSHDAFVELIDCGNRVEARTWNGYRVEIDLDTGRTKNLRFVK